MYRLLVPLYPQTVRGEEAAFRGAAQGGGQRTQCCQWPCEPSLESPAGPHSPDVSETGAHTLHRPPLSSLPTRSSLQGPWVDSEGDDGGAGGQLTALTGHLQGAGRHPAERGGGCTWTCPPSPGCWPPGAGALERWVGLHHVGPCGPLCNYLRTLDVVGSVTRGVGRDICSVEGTWGLSAHPGCGQRGRGSGDPEL